MPDLTFRVSERVATPTRSLFDLAIAREDKELATGLIALLRAVEADDDERLARDKQITQDYQFLRTWGSLVNADI